MAEIEAGFVPVFIFVWKNIKMTIRKLNSIKTPYPIDFLVIIEAPGKIESIKKSFKNFGWNSFEIIATQGHICDYKKGLKNIGFDKNFVEYGRGVSKEDIVSLISDWSRMSGHVFIATDRDQEGDVIAVDVQRHCLSKHPSVSRVDLTCLDEQGLKQAFEKAYPVALESAQPGAGRRIVDRLIGATFSGTNAQGLSMAVGRVQTALLSAFSKSQPAAHHCKLVLQSADRRGPFICEFPVTPDNLSQAQELVQKNLKLQEKGLVFTGAEKINARSPEPWCYAEGVLELAKKTGREIEDVAASMQRLYERGEISYPRSSASALSRSAIQKMARLAEDNGMRIEVDKFQEFTATKQSSHESCHPLGKSINLSASRINLDADELIMTLIGQNIVASAQPYVDELPNEQDLPQWIKDQGLVFKRRMSLWAQAWPKENPSIGIKKNSIKENALQLMLMHKLGRPSTQVAHATRIAARGLISEDMRLSRKGTEWLGASPVALLNLEMAPSVEDFFARLDELKSTAMAPALIHLLDRMKIYKECENTILKGMLQDSNSGFLHKSADGEKYP